MPNSEIKIFQSKDGNTEVQVRLEDETVWINQYQMEELFETDRTSITKHISNIYKSKELNKDSTSAKIAQVKKEGNRQITRKITFYNLDLIIAVGYRVNSKRGTQFRIWANKILNLKNKKQKLRSQNTGGKLEPNKSISVIRKARGYSKDAPDSYRDSVTIKYNNVILSLSKEMSC